MKIIEGYIGINNNLFEKYTRTLFGVTFVIKTFYAKNIYDVIFQLAFIQTFQNYILNLIRHSDVNTSKGKSCKVVLYKSSYERTRCRLLPI